MVSKLVTYFYVWWNLNIDSNSGHLKECCQIKIVIDYLLCISILFGILLILINKIGRINHEAKRYYARMQIHGQSQRFKFGHNKDLIKSKHIRILYIFTTDTLCVTLYAFLSLMWRNVYIFSLHSFRNFKQAQLIFVKSFFF